MASKLHDAALVAFAVCLALFEGPAEIACAAVFFAAILAGKLRGWKPGFAEAGMAIWLLAGIPGLAEASISGMKLSSATHLRPMLAIAFFVGAGSIAPAEDRVLRRMAFAFLGALALNAAYGYLQVTIGALPLDALLLKNKLSQQVWVPDRNGIARAASGLYYNRLKLAHVGVAGLGLLGVLALARPPPLSSKLRAIVAIAFLIILGAVVLTYARMALAAMTIGAVVLVLVLGRVKNVLAIAGAAALLIIAVLLTGFGAEHLSTVGRDIGIRLHMFGTAWHIFLDHPFIGVGHGMYRETVAPTFDGTGALMDAHNIWLQLLSETGAIGSIGFAMMLVASLYSVVVRVRRDRALTAPHVLADRFALFVQVVLLALGMTHVFWHHSPVALLFWSTLGMSRSSSTAAPSHL